MASQPCSPRVPFDDADADVIFCSSDGCTFHLYKVIIAKASPIMRDMFMLPESNPNERQIVGLTENAETLETLFQFCYPIQLPTITTIEHLLSVIEAAQKYEMAYVLDSVRHLMQPFLAKEPLRAYAIAYMHQMEDIARQAAHLFLGEGIQPYMSSDAIPNEFGMLPAVAIHNLHIYREKCITVAVNAVKDYDFILHGRHPHRIGRFGGPSPWRWTKPTFRPCKCPKDYILVDDSVPTWLIKYLDSLANTVANVPYGRVVSSFFTPEYFEEVLDSRDFCSTRCAVEAFNDLIDMSDLLANKVDEAVKAEKIQLPFAREGS